MHFYHVTMSSRTKLLVNPFSLLITAFILLLLVGCTPEYQIVEKTRYIHVGITKVLLEPLSRTALPDREIYIQANPEESTTILVTTIAGLMGDIKKRDERLEYISKLDDENQKIADEANVKEQARVSKLINEKVTEIKEDARKE